MSAPIDAAEAERRADVLLGAGWSRIDGRRAAPADAAVIIRVCRRRSPNGFSLGDAWALQELIARARRAPAERGR